MSETHYSLPKLHETVSNIGSALEHKQEEVKIVQQKLQNKSNRIQDLRCLITLRSGYYLRMTANNAVIDPKLSYMNNNELETRESLNSVRDLTNIKTDVNRFLLQIIKSISTLPEFLVDVTTESLQKATAFLPPSIEPRAFLASSTFPALFGFCWTDEFKKGYIKFLAKIAKNLPPQTFDNFRNHWLFDCYKNFIHASNISTFLKPSLSEIIFELINDKNIQDLSKKNDSTGLFNALIKYAEKMIRNMSDNIPLFPADVHLLISSFAETAEDEQAKTKLVELLFIDCILAPAISLPKTYSLLPPSFNYTLDSAGSSRAMVLLAQIFRLILHPAQAKLRYAHVDHKTLSELPFQDFLTKISSKIDSQTGPRLIDILPLAETKSVSLLFSTVDIQMLALLFKSVTKWPQWATQIVVSANKVPITTPLDITYFRYNTWDISSYDITISNYQDVKLETASESPVNSAASALMRFLLYAKIDPNAPEQLGEFLDHHQHIVLLKEDFMTHTYLNNLVQKMMAVPAQDQCQILPALEQEIIRYRTYITRLSELITRISLHHLMIHEVEDSVIKQSQALLPVLLSNLNELFISSNPDLATEFHTKRQQMLEDKTVFRDYLWKVEARIKEFFSDSAQYIKEGVAEHFHSWMMQQIPLSDFTSLHPEFAQIDKEISNVSPHVIESVCVQPSPKKIQDILESPPLFLYVQQELSAAASIIIPAEAGRHIKSAIDLLSKIFELCCEGSPQADEMTPLLNYSLLTSGVPNLHSFTSYLEHFYHEINQKEFKVVPDPTAIAVTHLVNHATSLHRVINSSDF